MKSVAIVIFIVVGTIGGIGFACARASATEAGSDRFGVSSRTAARLLPGTTGESTLTVTKSGSSVPAIDFNGFASGDDIILCDDGWDCVCLNAACTANVRVVSGVGRLTSPSGWTLEGSGLSLTTNGGSLTTGTLVVGTSGGTITRTLPGSDTIDFASTASGACAADGSITVTGAANGDACFVGATAAAMVAGAQYECNGSGTNTVAVRMCCNGTLTCDPPSASFKVIVLQQ